jgi:hypothetical protein
MPARKYVVPAVVVLCAFGFSLPAVICTYKKSTREKKIEG